MKPGDMIGIRTYAENLYENRHVPGTTGSPPIGIMEKGETGILLEVARDDQGTDVYRILTCKGAIGWISPFGSWSVRVLG